MSDPLRINYTPRPDARAGNELNALAAVYKFILDRHAKKEASGRDTQLQPRKEVRDEPLR